MLSVWSPQAFSVRIELDKSRYIVNFSFWLYYDILNWVNQVASTLQTYSAIHWALILEEYSKVSGFPNYAGSYSNHIFCFFVLNILVLFFMACCLFLPDCVLAFPASVIKLMPPSKSMWRDTEEATRRIGRCEEEPAREEWSTAKESIGDG